MEFFDYLYQLLIADKQYMTILKGLGNTLLIAAVAAAVSYTHLTLPTKA